MSNLVDAVRSKIYKFFSLMNKGLSITKLIAIGNIATLDFFIGIAASQISIYSGIPISSGAITAIEGSILGLVCLLIIDTSGAFTIYQFIYTLMALPTFIWGPPGFLPKVIVGISIGIAVDVTYYYLKKLNKIFALFACVMLMSLFGTIIFILLARLFHMPGVEKTITLISSPLSIVGFVLIAIFDTWVALKIFNKVKDAAVVKRIQGL